jgi:hypothetical protein
MPIKCGIGIAYRTSVQVAFVSGSTWFNDRQRPIGARLIVSLEQSLISVLAVDCPVDSRDHELSVTNVSTTCAALAALRVMQFELMVTRLAVAGQPVWPLAAKVRALRPAMRWVLVAPQLAREEESHARMFGVARIIDSGWVGHGLSTAFERKPVSPRTYTPAISGHR